jgi:hypothetical protein
MMEMMPLTDARERIKSLQYMRNFYSRLQDLKQDVTVCVCVCVCVCLK